ncbi:hypothetical protein BDV36DRAFT_276284 [Aspergillus pseudocaelatus]|uniref:HD/PDEase domain-containing protein n=1 Tax=Aspergillus pseudocaelatus TaxID=1825620 RepID=A0ABQ6W198_9EURO|nr:hypothetical protein BDV36DRAFT_276284 [Aspergillus pseudocaelatus]
MCCLAQQAEAAEHPCSRHGTCPSWMPKNDVCAGAFELAQSSLPEPILNHSLRVYCYAKWISEHCTSSSIDTSKYDLLFVACIMHDIGCSDKFNGSERFEVEGADASVDYLRTHLVAEESTKQVWQAIALHTSPGIAERIDPFTRLVRLGVLTDFGSYAEVDREFREATERDLPRLGIEKVLGDTVVAQALDCPKKAPAASWPGDLLRAKLESPAWDGVNKAF